MGNELVADVEPSVSKEDGITLVDFAVDMKGAAENGDWCEAGINAGAAGLDALAVVADPFGELLSSAFAWAMEHVSPLPEMLDKLAGNPDVVQANAETWANVSEALSNAAKDMERSVDADTAQWQGPAIDAYKAVAVGEAKLVEAASTAASGVGAAVSGAGIAVATVRTTVRDLIAEAMADLVKVLIREAAALAVSLGAATPLLVADVIATVAKWSTRVAEWLQKIVNSIKALAEIVKKLKPVLDKVKDAMEPLKKVSKAADRGPSIDTVGQHLMRDGAVSGGTVDEKGYAEKTAEQ